MLRSHRRDGGPVLMQQRGEHGLRLDGRVGSPVSAIVSPRRGPLRSQVSRAPPRSTEPTRMLVRLLPALLVTVALALGAHALSSQAFVGLPLSPDLDQEAPSKLVVTRAGDGYVLGFRSVVRNVGDGPLIVS